MCSKSYQKQEIKRSGNGILNAFMRSTFIIKRVCIICHLTLCNTPSSITSLIDIIYLFLKTGLELEGGGGV